MDIVVPIVFPDYKITVEVAPREVDVLPWFEFDNFTVEHKAKYSNLGHAGVFFANGATGVTKYYEYGRYDGAGLGLVRRVPIPDAQTAGGTISLSSLKPVFKKISQVSGQNGRLQGVYLEVQGKFQAMLDEAERRKKLNGDANRRKYDILNYSCIHFVKSITEKAGVEAPWMIDPRPNSYIGEFRDDFPDLDYKPMENKLIIEGKGQI